MRLLYIIFFDNHLAVSVLVLRNFLCFNVYGNLPLMFEKMFNLQTSADFIGLVKLGGCTRIGGASSGT